MPLEPYPAKLGVWHEEASLKEPGCTKLSQCLYAIEALVQHLMTPFSWHDR